MDLQSILMLLIFVAVNFLVATSGVVFRPGPWYEALDKPSWIPPRWVFPTVWSVLYLMNALAGWLVWREAGFFLSIFAIYGIQLALNGLWSGLFFGLRRGAFAFADIVLLWLAIAANIAVFAAISALAAWLLVPYLLWVSVAGALNLAVWRRNPVAFGGRA